MRSGFVGLGIMGTPMVLHLNTGGRELYLYNRTGVPQELSGAGAAGMSGNGSAEYPR